MKKYIYLLIFVLGCVSFLLPNRYYPWQSVYHESSMFLVFLLIFSILLIKARKLILDKKMMGVFLISCIPLLQYLLGKIYFFGDALIASLYIFGFASAIVFGFNLTKFNNKKQILKFISLVLISSALISIYMILQQWLMLTYGSLWIIDVPNNRPFANFAQPNNCATFLLLSLMATLYLYEEKVLNSISGVILGVLLLFCVALTQSRSPWIFAICFIFWWYWKTNDFKTRLNKHSILYFLGIYSLFIYMLPKASTFIGVFGGAGLVERATTGYLRIPMWQQLLLALKQEPLWGYGWNQVSVAQITIFSKYPTKEWTEHSHNILLDLLIWNGLPLGLLIIGFFVWWLFVLSKLVVNSENFIALAMIGVVLNHGLLEFPLEYATFLLPIGFLFGFVYADALNIKLVELSRKVTIPIFTCSVILFVGVFIEYCIMEKETRLVRAEILNIGKSEVTQAVPEIFLLTQLRERIRYLRTEPKENMTDEQLLWMKKVTYRYATPNNLYKYAQALLLNNQKDKAKYYMNILNELYSENIDFQSLYNIRKSNAYQWNKPKVKSE